MQGNIIWLHLSLLQQDSTLCYCNAVTFHQTEFKEHMCCMFLSFTKSLRLDFSHLLFGSFQCIYCTEMQGLKDFKTSDLHTHTPSVALSKLLSICPCNTLLNMQLHIKVVELEKSRVVGLNVKDSFYFKTALHKAGVANRTLIKHVFGLVVSSLYLKTCV